MKIDKLSDYGIVGNESKTEKLFLKLEKHFNSNTEMPSVYVENLWKKYKNNKDEKNNSLNGYFFEAIISSLLFKEHITPFYRQAKLQFVPNIDFDIILFPCIEGTVDVSAPICISLKVSLRERYKQADLEGIALKNVYKRALCYLITLDKAEEIDKFERKIKDKDIQGIDECINATSDRFNDLINQLKWQSVSAPPEIQAVKDAKVVW